MMTHANRRRQWRARVADYHASELTMREWCEINGFRVDQLRYWLRKSGETQQGQSWACLSVADDVVAKAADVPGTARELNQAATGDVGISVRIGAAMVEVRPGFDPSLLSDVLRVVVATC